MGSSIVLRLLKVTHYYRNKRAKKWYLPFGYGAEDINLNNISLHIYQGESLGIIGEPGSSKTLIGRILSGTVKPDKGKVSRTENLFYGDMEDRKVAHQSVQEYVDDMVQLFPYKASSHKAEQIIHWAHLAEQGENSISNLTEAEYAQLLLSIARSCQNKIIILSHVLSHLDDVFFKRAIELSDDYIKNNSTLVLIDNDIDKISETTNYITWVSHGKIRKEGSLNQVLPIFKEHEKDRKSLDSKSQLENFDLDWKKSRTRMPEMTYNFKRIERYNHAKPPVFLVRILTLFASFLIGLTLMGILLFNDLGRVHVSENYTQASIQNQNKDPYEDKLTYGIALDGSTTLSGTQDSTLPKYGVATITGENSKKYRVEMDHKIYTVGKNELFNFNPAGLYESHSFKTLMPYIKTNYSTYYEYFNSHLHQKHNKVTKTLVPEKDNRYVVPITQQPLNMIFGDNDTLTGFVIPMEHKTDLKKKFNIKKDVWITKSGSGYFIADMKDDKWIYIEL
ncbi:ATP-binding cassette domain-containing protein [Staphylococcus capitis]|uniref:ATP-binding cassette domain-containing protein n=1 Tax=Staphylococcus capitis TaxID=29388 RepID=UPI0011A6E1D2|nr:ATP-binding cassette domain-containing protein [Staphylococcus capitis]